MQIREFMTQPVVTVYEDISATDPVAVVAVFRRLGAPQRLTVMVEGESLFNDATSLVLGRVPGAGG
jgi:hypothetical protein